MYKSWANDTPIESKEDEKEEGESKQQDESQDTKGIDEQGVNYFWDISFGLEEGEEEDIEEIHMSQNVVTTRSGSMTSSSDSPSTFEPIRQHPIHRRHK
jgi:hypothetical protein